MQNSNPAMPALAVKGALDFRLDPACRTAFLLTEGGEAWGARLSAALRGEASRAGLDIVIGGEGMRRLAPHRRPLAFLPARPVLPSALTPRDVLALLPSPLLSPKAALAALGLGARADTPWRHLSPSERRRLMLAAFLCRHPSPALLVVEEPEEGLDAATLRHLGALLDPGGAFGEAAFLLLARQAASVFALAKEVGLLHEGGLGVIAAPQRLYEEPPDLLTALAMGPANLLPVRLVAVEDDEAEVECADGRRFWCAAPPPGVALGERTCLMIRPERIAMAALAAAELEGGAITAVITRVLERGSGVVFHLHLDLGAAWEVWRPAALGGRLQAGERVLLAWPERAARLYPFAPRGAEGDGERAR